MKKLIYILLLLITFPANAQWEIPPNSPTVTVMSFTGAGLVAYNFVGWYTNGHLEQREGLLLTGAALVVTSIIINELNIRKSRINFTGNGISIDLGIRKVKSHKRKHNERNRTNRPAEDQAAS